MKAPARIEIHGGAPLGGRLRARVEARLAAALGRLRVAPVTGRATFADDNGPRGGRAMRCALTVRRPRRPPLRVEAVAESAWLAFDRSLEILRRRLAADGERGLKRGRYPKKYYAAKRLLKGEA
jgi:hypothetical protein